MPGGCARFCTCWNYLSPCRCQSSANVPTSRVFGFNGGWSTTDWTANVFNMRGLSISSITLCMINMITCEANKPVTCIKRAGAYRTLIWVSPKINIIGAKCNTSVSRRSRRCLSRCGVPRERLRIPVSISIPTLSNIPHGHLLCLMTESQVSGQTWIDRSRNRHWIWR